MPSRRARAVVRRRPRRGRRAGRNAKAGSRCRRRIGDAGDLGKSSREASPGIALVDGKLASEVAARRSPHVRPYPCRRMHGGLLRRTGGLFWRRPGAVRRIPPLQFVYGGRGVMPRCRRRDTLRSNTEVRGFRAGQNRPTRLRSLVHTRRDRALVGAVLAAHPDTSTARRCARSRTGWAPRRTRDRVCRSRVAPRQAVTPSKSTRRSLRRTPHRLHGAARADSSRCRISGGEVSPPPGLDCRDDHPFRSCWLAVEIAARRDARSHRQADSDSLW